MTYMYWFLAALIIAGWLVVWISSRRALKRTCAELRVEFERQILSAKIDAVERATGGRIAAPPISAGVESGSAASPISPQALSAEEITPETLATIAKTVTALLGRKVLVRSVKMLPAPDATVNPWAEHGRAVVQASHDFSQRSRP
jgi:hypothetical protein